MVDPLSPEARSKQMARVRGKDTVPEMQVRRLTHAMGYRYRLHVRELPGCPDMVFPRRRKVIFIHGCFWHRHSDPDCKLARLPKTNADFWEKKFQENIARDARCFSELTAMGWSILVIWECELKNKVALASLIREFLEL